jgi:23S rRNA (cytidine1920-2'-O)/16S rRNA (cytidine1409-2'-O)-methyltransferase
VPRLLRLDAELVRRGLARSREHAASLVESGRVEVAGRAATKPATSVSMETSLRIVDADAPDYVSRGGHKLAGALDAFEADGLTVEGKRCLDAGASTGGFTDVLLRRGASSVVAVDVGYGQLAWSIRTDDRVMVLERTNVRTLTLDQVGAPVEIVVGDLSFISLTLVIPALSGVTVAGGDLVLMVKPQFEVGRERIPDGGVVRDPAVRADAVRRVADAAGLVGLGVRGVTASPLPGPAGNVEYFLWLTAGAPALDAAALATAIEEGPQ